MLEITETEVYGWEAAIRGMRNPKNSWEKSDSKFIKNKAVLGDKDLKLMTTLSHAGSDHGKFLRMIVVTMDVTAPLYWFKEFDTYKIGTVSDSCSTMHKIQAKEFTLDDFSHDHLNDISITKLKEFISLIEVYRKEFNDSGNKDDWWQMIQLLPSSYNQKRTIQLNYQVLKNMYHSRKNHKLDEWHTFCDWIETLPYAKELILD